MMKRVVQDLDQFCNQSLILKQIPKRLEIMEKREIKLEMMVDTTKKLCLVILQRNLAANDFRTNIKRLISPVQDIMNLRIYEEGFLE